MKRSKNNTRGSEGIEDLEGMELLTGGVSAKEELQVYQTRESEDGLSKIYRVFINEEIREPAYYNQLFVTLATVTEEDIVEFCINSGGGEASTLIELITYISICPATTKAMIVGCAHSAASMLALSCSQIEVYPYASMLIHTYSGGVVGKHSDIRSQFTHDSKYYKGFFSKIYTNFLTKTEIARVWRGEDIWLDSESIRKRLVSYVGGAGNTVSNSTVSGED